MQKKMNIFTRIYCKFCRGILLSGMYIMFRPKIKYVDKAVDKESRKKPAIIIANHTSLYDGIFMLAVMHKHRSYMLVAKDWYDKPFAGTIIAGNRCIPTDRTGMDTAWIRECSKVIKEGNSVCIFPEGHRAKSGTLDEFKSGFALLAQMTGAPIITVCMSGPYKRFFGPRKKVLVDIPRELSYAENRMSADYLEAEGIRFRNHMFELQTMSETLFACKKQSFGESVDEANTEMKQEARQVG